jgi:hypothetical protein
VRDTEANALTCCCVRAGWSRSILGYGSLDNESTCAASITGVVTIAAALTLVNWRGGLSSSRG